MASEVFFSLMMRFSKILQFYHVIFHHALHLNISQTHRPLFYWCSALSFQRFQKLQPESCKKNNNFQLMQWCSHKRKSHTLNILYNVWIKCGKRWF